MKKKMFQAAAVAAMAISLSGCIGQMATTGTVTKMNLSVSNNAWVQEGFFILLLPVTAVTATIDVLVVNSIEFWTGTNPVSGKPRITGSDPKDILVTQDNIKVKSVSEFEIIAEVTADNGSVETLRLVRTDSGIDVLNQDGMKVAIWTGSLPQSSDS
ncbi:MAG: DUF3332 family protein [Endozoicomonas sp.]